MMHLICLATAIVTLVACSQAAHDPEPRVDEYASRAPGPPPSPQVEPASDSGRRTGGTRLPIESSYICGWNPHPPREHVVLVDIFLSRFGPDTPPVRAEIDSVRALGGEVRHLFHVPVIRAQIERDRVPVLVESGLARTVLTVSDERRQDLYVRIFFTRPAQGSNADRVAQLGGHVEWRPDPINDGRPMMDALVPDSAIPYIKAIPGFERIGVGSACVRGV